jgi:hypothetical protein
MFPARVYPLKPGLAFASLGFLLTRILMTYHELLHSLLSIAHDMAANRGSPRYGKRVHRLHRRMSGLSVETQRQLFSELRRLVPDAFEPEHG